MKQVNPKIYDRDFYERVYGNSNELTSTDFEKSKDYYKELVDIVSLNENSQVVDFGCGNGNLSFYIYKRFQSKVIGIDYSQDAISICMERLAVLKKKWGVIPVKFYCYNNDALPKYKNIDVVFFCDVVEHMYDDEIDKVLAVMKKWNKIGKIDIAIHTDNAIYLKYVRPCLNLLYIFLGYKSFSDIKKEKEVESLVHVNITNPMAFKNKMKKLGYEEVSFKYTGITKDKIAKQLGTLNSLPFLQSFSYIILSIFSFLSPSFFAVYRSNR